MRVAALNDIHSNLPALEAVLQEVRQARIDQIVVGGDVVLGPMPRESLDALFNLDIPIQFIQGNCEREFLNEVTGKETAMPERYRVVNRWMAEQLPPEYIQKIAAWGKTLQMDIPPLGKVLFCHATPRDDNEIFTRLTPEEALIPIFEPFNVDVIVCGHTHMQFDRMVGKTRVVNTGSIGQPHGEPGAYWLLLGDTIEFRRTSYDFNEAAERIRATSH